ncbi:hypothetical protein I6H56_07460 [Fusobacterium canifelinum]|uniref:Uncharacterized protein n=1 Tax=Fusobacterium canifelinum TaxID=285729 RepID=A0A7T4FME3_9FUSO|nr:hypothetical protein [Fusobacterium canifelinum]QQB73155.1 hypothetical protein I6H56_07460 [Fusobacterium canifelinum]
MCKKNLLKSLENNSIFMTSELNKILNKELKSGNKIKEIWKGKWGKENILFILLEKPFKTTVQKNLKEISFNNINDRHYWKDEYYDKKNHILLACSFEK